MMRRGVVPAIAVLAVTVLAVMASPSLAAQSGEAARVIKEACGDEPEADCVAGLRKVCHAKLTMRCYLSRKSRLDRNTDDLDTPEKKDERDDRSIFYDE